MAKLATDTKVITNKVRLSFVHLLEPHAFEGQKPKFSTMLLIPKEDTETLDLIEKATRNAYEAAKNDKLKGIKYDRVKTNLRDGDEEFDPEERPEMVGMMFMNVSSVNKPGIIDKYKNEVTSDDEVYSGVYGRVSINFYAYNTAGNKGISAGLNNVQIVEKGEYLGGRASADSDFDEWEDDEDLDEYM